MDEIITWIWAASPWHWWAVAVVLIALEVIAPTTYFLWPAGAAAVTGLLLWAIPSLDWRVQILIFAILSLLTVLAWHRWQKTHKSRDAAPNLNLRASRYVGLKVTLADALKDGRGRAHIDDSWWQVRTIDGSSIDAGVTVEVIGHHGTILTVQADHGPN